MFETFEYGRKSDSNEPNQARHALICEFISTKATVVKDEGKGDPGREREREAEWMREYRSLEELTGRIWDRNHGIFDY